MSELARVVRPGGRLVVGETAADPHRVRLPTLIEHMRRAALRGGRTAGRIGYFARFDNPMSRFDVMTLEAPPQAIPPDYDRQPERFRVALGASPPQYGHGHPRGRGAPACDSP